MSGSLAALKNLIDPVPPDLADYFAEISSGEFKERWRSEVNLFDPLQVMKQTLDWREWSGTVGVLGGILLDDGNTSNHHIYLSIPCCAGTVLFLDHDGDSRIVFSSLAEFLQAVRTAIADDQFISRLHPNDGIELPDQSGLTEFIESVYTEKIDCRGEATTVLTCLLPSLQIKDTPLIREMTQDRDFYLGEAIGLAIESRPRPDLKPLATLLKKHRHPQVANAGERALTAIAGKRPERGQAVKPRELTEFSPEEIQNEISQLMKAIEKSRRNRDC